MMDDWHWLLMQTRRRRVGLRLAIKVLLFGGFLLIAGVSLAYAQVPPVGAPVAGVYNSVAPTFRDKTGATLQTDENGVLKVTGGGTGGGVTLATQAYTATASFTINAASAHIANDVVGAAAAALTFANICPGAGREVIFTSTRFRYDIAAVPAGMTSFRLYLYNVTPPSALADDAPFDLPSGDRASFLGYIDLGTPVDLGSTLYVETNGNQKQVTCASTSVFGYLVTNGAYTTGTDVVTLVVKTVAP